MRPLVCIPSGDLLTCQWMLDNPQRSEFGNTFSMTLSRVVLGVWLESPCSAVVVGERFKRHQERTETWWVTLDEAEDALLNNLIGRLILLKDQYRVRTLYCPDRPPHLVQTLRQTEGLSYYRTEDIDQARRLWPSWTSFDLRCGISTLATPDEEAVHRDLEHWLQTTAVDPATGEPMQGLDGTPIPKLNLPYDFPIQHTQSALRQALKGPCTALWMALQALARTPYRAPKPNSGPKKGENAGPNPVTGY